VLDAIEGVMSGNDEQRVDAWLEAGMKWRGSNGKSEKFDFSANINLIYDDNDLTKRNSERIPFAMVSVMPFLM